MQEVVAGIDIGGTNTVIGIVTRNGDILKECSIPTKGQITFDGYVKTISAEIDRLLSELEHEFMLKGVGIGAPNGSYNLGAIVDAPGLERNSAFV